MLDRKWGVRSFWFWVVGFYVAFMPLYVLGLMGVTRRLQHISNPAARPWFEIAAFGALLIAIGIACMLMQFYVSIRDRERLRDLTGDPWNARTLEWSTASPAPDYNFAFIPVVHEVDAWHDMKTRGYVRPVEGFNAIHMPKNTATGVVIGALATIFGFAMVWQIWWMVIVSAVGLFATVITHSFNYDRSFHVPVEDVILAENARTRILGQGGTPA